MENKICRYFYLGDDFLGKKKNSKEKRKLIKFPSAIKESKNKFSLHCFYLFLGGVYEGNYMRITLFSYI